MLSYIRGNLEAVGLDHVVVESGHIGFHILMPGSALGDLPAIGDAIKIHTYLHVREDAMTLFGFLTAEDKEAFMKLITVNGIGPKGAMGILSFMDGHELAMAVMTGNVDAICQAPGIGKKTAQKLILDLKDKFHLADYTEVTREAIQEASGQHGQKASEEALEALLSLGYSVFEARKALKGINPNQDVEAIIKEALKRLALI